MKNGIERVKTNVSEDDLLEQVFELNLATITWLNLGQKGKHERKITNNLETFSYFCYSVANSWGFSLYPKNKKYGKIVAKSVRTFGTDKELENVIEYLEERLNKEGFISFHFKSSQ